jgi:AcrR family transcriptional regulator
MKANEPSDQVRFSPNLRAAFLPVCVRVPLAKLIPLKKVPEKLKLSKKYQQILSSVREVGLVEPPAVAQVSGRPGSYFLLDGHTRIEALKELGIEAVDCMVAVDDDTYTYNKRVNRLSAVQEHKMVVAAADRGVSVERLAAALGLSESTIRHRFRMLNGICEEVISYLADKPCPAKVFTFLRQLKPLRQMDAAELMVGQNNYSTAFATAIVATTSPEQLCDSPTVKLPGDEVSIESMAILEKELATLQMQNSIVEDTYGPDVLHLVVIKNYWATLLGRASVVKWLAQHQPEYLREFQRIAEMTELSQPSRTPRSN